MAFGLGRLFRIGRVVRRPLKFALNRKLTGKFSKLPSVNREFRGLRSAARTAPMTAPATGNTWFRNRLAQVRARPLPQAVRRPKRAPRQAAQMRLAQIKRVGIRRRVRRYGIGLGAAGGLGGLVVLNRNRQQSPQY